MFSGFRPTNGLASRPVLSIQWPVEPPLFKLLMLAFQGLQRKQSKTTLEVHLTTTTTCLSIHCSSYATAALIIVWQCLHDSLGSVTVHPITMSWDTFGLSRAHSIEKPTHGISVLSLPRLLPAQRIMNCCCRKRHCLLHCSTHCCLGQARSNRWVLKKQGLWM